MYLRFEDWSYFTRTLDEKGVLHGGRIIKVFATDEDPRLKFGKQSLVVVESNDEPFSDEIFDFQERGIFTGEDLERAIAQKQVNEIAERTARALARFAAREDTRFAYSGMQMRIGSRFLIDHPIDGIDGWEFALRGQAERMHLDIISRTSLERLRQIVDFDNPEQILLLSEVRDFMRAERKKEGKARHL